MRTRSRTVSLVVVLWLLIGLVAAAQRNYFTNRQASCATVATLLVTVVAGPLNYVGANPRVRCEVPQPSR